MYASTTTIVILKPLLQPGALPRGTSYAARPPPHCTPTRISLHLHERLVQCGELTDVDFFERVTATDCTGDKIHVGGKVEHGTDTG